MPKINKNEGKLRLKLFGKDRLRSAIKKAPQHLKKGLERSFLNSSMTQAEIYLCNSILEEV